MKIKGGYIILAGILFFIFGKILYSIFPISLIAQTIATIATLSLWVFIGIGIITLLRSRGDKNDNNKNNEIKTNHTQRFYSNRKEPKTSKDNYGVSDKLLRNVIITGIIIVSFSISYYFFYIPFYKNYNFNKCLKESEETLVQKKQEINSHIDDLEKKKTVAQQEAESDLSFFLENNPEPDINLYPMNNGYIPKDNSYFELKKSVNWANLNTKAKWQSDKDAIFSIVRQIESQIRNIQTDYKKIENEKKNADEICYKKFK
jgi:hypothetical protein